ncbi:MAG: hypothetical protein K0S24_3744 [Sphingobacterium sp.]|jgi:hypothetical protein|nr:hypothetical protein [Sphingobacterium sp.]
MYLKEGLSWNFISLFYDRTNWDILIEKINDFETEICTRCKDFLISFSEEKGDNIRLTISSEIGDYEYIRKETYTYFSSFFIESPSVQEKKVAYGKMFWRGYDNNSIAFDIFKLTHYGQHDIDLIKKTNNVIFKLVHPDYSQDNFSSLSLYLMITLLKLFIVKDDRKLVLNSMMSSVANDFRSYGLLNKISKLMKEEAIDERDLEEILDSYLESDPPDDIAIWSDLVYTFESPRIQENFIFIIEQLFETLGQNQYHRALSLKILQSWVDNKNGLF